MSHRVEYVSPEPVRRQRSPRIRDKDHLALLHELPCVVCGSSPVEAAHIRTPCLELGKRPIGAAEKASDLWTLPLCPTCHREQHSMNERRFWKQYGINPFVTALALWAARDVETMRMIVAEARRT